MACQLLHRRYVRAGVQEVGDYEATEIMGAAGTHARLIGTPAQDVEYCLVRHAQRHDMAGASDPVEQGSWFVTACLNPVAHSRPCSIAQVHHAGFVALAMPHGQRTIIPITEIKCHSFGASETASVERGEQCGISYTRWARIVAAYRK